MRENRRTHPKTWREKVVQPKVSIESVISTGMRR